MNVASVTRRMTAVTRPQKITLRRTTSGTRAAAMLMTTTLSPASTMSMSTTWISAKNPP